MPLKQVGPYNRGARQRAIARNRSELPATRDMVNNLLSIYCISTEAERISGENWYWLANVEAERATSGHPQAAAIVAALSPQNSWHQNLMDVASLIEGDPPTHRKMNEDKARAILAGGDPNTILGGRKVRSFWRNIENPDRPGPVTIDRHACAAALIGANRVPEHIRQAFAHRILERIGTYQIIAGAYRTAARLLDLRPHECQATIWITWRRFQDISWRNKDPF